MLRFIISSNGLQFASPLNVILVGLFPLFATMNSLKTSWWQLQLVINFATNDLKISARFRFIIGNNIFKDGAGCIVINDAWITIPLKNWEWQVITWIDGLRLLNKFLVTLMISNQSWPAHFFMCFSHYTCWEIHHKLFLLQRLVFLPKKSTISLFLKYTCSTGVH